ncbi:MAG TPA: hypothetical protein VGE47_01610 [Burkholderiaceae bacterium]
MLTLSPANGVLPVQTGPSITQSFALTSSTPGAGIEVLFQLIPPPGLSFVVVGQTSPVQIQVYGSLAGPGVPTGATFPYNVFIHFIATDGSDNSRVRGMFQLPVRPTNAYQALAS